jgi:hypothetical protein
MRSVTVTPSTVSVVIASNEGAGALGAAEGRGEGGNVGAIVGVILDASDGVGAAVGEAQANTIKAMTRVLRSIM